MPRWPEVFTRFHFMLKDYTGDKQIEIGDIEVWMVSPEDLIISKIIWIQELKSDKQIHDIKNLLAIPGVDTEYVVYWCRKLQLNTYKLVDYE